MSLWHRLYEGGVAPLCFLTFYLESELTPLVVEFFQISGFLVLVREREREIT